MRWNWKRYLPAEILWASGVLVWILDWWDRAQSVLAKVKVAAPFMAPVIELALKWGPFGLIALGLVDIYRANRKQRHTAALAVTEPAAPDKNAVTKADANAPVWGAPVIPIAQLKTLEALDSLIKSGSSPTPTQAAPTFTVLLRITHVRIMHVHETPDRVLLYVHVINRSKTDRVVLTFGLTLFSDREERWSQQVVQKFHLAESVSLDPQGDIHGELCFDQPAKEWLRAFAPLIKPEDLPAPDDRIRLQVTDHVSGKRLTVVVNVSDTEWL